MPSRTVSVLRFEALEIASQRLRWLLPLVYLLISGAMFLRQAHSASVRLNDSLGWLALFAILAATAIGVRVSKKQQLATLVHPFTRAVGRFRVLAVRLSVMLVIGVMVFGSLGLTAALVQQEPILRSSLVLEDFETLRVFDAAGYTLSFDDAETAADYQHGRTPQSRWCQRGTIKGLLSPHLVAAALGFVLYLLVTLCVLDPTQFAFDRKSLRSWLHFVSSLPLFLAGFGGDQLMSAGGATFVYLHPGATASLLFGLLAVYAAFCCWRWRTADL